MKKVFLKKWMLLIASIIFVSLLVACQGSNENAKNNENGESTGNDVRSKSAEDVINEELPHPIVTMTMENGGEVTIQLIPEVAPNTVNNFISLVEDGFYNGLIFHRVIPGFMIQGGDPSGNGTGGPGYSIKGEFNNNGFDNNLTHERNVISMARSQHPDSAGSQFFIMVDDAPHLDGEYAAFGIVTAGMDVVDDIVNAERDKMDKPLEDQTIKSVEVDLAGYEAQKPETIK